jgi:hypothetical protein
MITITARNVNDALPQGVALLRRQGVREDSRNGPVLRAPCPVTTVYERPCERVLFDPVRDANPFMHLVEALWMIAGRDDLKQLTPYVKRMADFSDDGGRTQPGAYGERWRQHWYATDKVEDTDSSYTLRVLDQLNWAIRRLRTNPSDRRVVISMWDPGVDIPAADAGGKDVPCNLNMMPWVSDGRLHLSITNRSNDIIMGLYGANAVHFSLVLEYMAVRIGLPVGTMTVFSNNYHAYLADLPKVETAGLASWAGPYVTGLVEPLPIFDDWDVSSPSWEKGREKHKEHLDVESDEQRERVLQEDLRVFFDHGAFEASTKARWSFLRRVAAPMALAHEHWRETRGEDRFLGATEILQQVAATDWRLAALEWVGRRHQRWVKAADDGVGHG